MVGEAVLCWWKFYFEDECTSHHVDGTEIREKCQMCDAVRFMTCDNCALACLISKVHSFLIVGIIIICKINYSLFFT